MLYRPLTFVVVLMALMSFGVLTRAADQEAVNPAVSGQLISASADQIVVQPAEMGDQPSEQVAVPIDEDTRITLDGETSSVDQLKAGMEVTIPAYDDAASAVFARTPAAPAAEE